MGRHFEQARLLANRAGAAARCEVAAWLALTAARLGARTGDEELLALAESAADETTALVAGLPGHPPWGPQANAARAEIALARGDAAAAAAVGEASLQALGETLTEDAHMETVLSASGGILAAAPPEVQEQVRGLLRARSPGSRRARSTTGSGSAGCEARWGASSWGWPGSTPRRSRRPAVRPVLPARAHRSRVRSRRSTRSTAGSPTS
jgi:hypothetical protein